MKSFKQYWYKKSNAEFRNQQTNKHDVNSASPCAYSTKLM
jgi:hypothetical protein